MWVGAFFVISGYVAGYTATGVAEACARRACSGSAQHCWGAVMQRAALLGRCERVGSTVRRSANHAVMWHCSCAGPHFPSGHVLHLADHKKQETRLVDTAALLSAPHCPTTRNRAGRHSCPACTPLLAVSRAGQVRGQPPREACRRLHRGPRGWLLPPLRHRQHPVWWVTLERCEQGRNDACV